MKEKTGKPRFRPGAFYWIATLILLAVAGYGAFASERMHQLEPAAVVAHGTSAFIQRLLLGLFAAWFCGGAAWLLSGRRRRVGGTAMVVAALLFMLGTWAVVGHESGYHSALARMQPVVHAARAEIQAAQALPALSGADVAATTRRVHDLFDKHDGEDQSERQLALALRDVMVEAAQRELAYAAAVLPVFNRPALDYARLEDPAELQRRREDIRRFRSATEAYRSLPPSQEDRLRDIARLHQLPPKFAGMFAASFVAGRERSNAQLAPMHEARMAWADALDALYAMLEERPDSWEVGPDGGILLATDADFERFSALAERYDASFARLVEVEEAL